MFINPGTSRNQSSILEKLTCKISNSYKKINLFSKTLIYIQCENMKYNNKKYTRIYLTLKQIKKNNSP